MHHQIAGIIAGFGAAQERLHRLAERLEPDQWTRRPKPGSWSVAECVEHLNLTSRAYLPLLEKALADARELREPAPRQYRRDPTGWLLSLIMPPPVRLRLPTPAAFVPGADRPPGELLADFDALQAAQVSLARSADGLPIQKVRVASPFSPRASYNAFSALSILPPHQERHIWQAERTVA